MPSKAAVCAAECSERREVASLTFADCADRTDQVEKAVEHGDEHAQGSLIKYTIRALIAADEEWRNRHRAKAKSLSQSRLSFYSTK
jgi:hypothetical protein